MKFEHVRAHSQASDVHSVGNRLADYKANSVRLRPQLAMPVTVRELPLAECEHRLTVWSKHGQQIIDDIRRSALAQLKEQSLELWQKGTPSYAKDGLFAGRALLETSKFVLARGSKEQQSTFIHIATNSIQFRWVEPAGAPRVVASLLCTFCNEELNLQHITKCPSRNSVDFRARLRLEVLTTLSSDASTKPWLDKNKRLELTLLLTRLFPAPQNTPVDPHITRVMCGVISTRQVNAAAKSLGLAHPVHGPLLVREISLVCLTAVQQFYDSAKSQPH